MPIKTITLSVAAMQATPNACKIHFVQYYSWQFIFCVWRIVLMSCIMNLFHSWPRGFALPLSVPFSHSLYFVVFDRDNCKMIRATKRCVHLISVYLWVMYNMLWHHICTYIVISFSSNGSRVYGFRWCCCCRSLSCVFLELSAFSSL